MKKGSSSSVMNESIGKGQTIRSATAQDTAGGMDLPKARKMGGGVDNIAHSLTGASVVNDVK